MNLPIVDMHCDMLSYLATVPGANAFAPDQIACAVPWLVKGNVRMQVMAIYTDVRPDANLASRQAEIFQRLWKENSNSIGYAGPEFLGNWDKQTQVGIIASVENAAGFGNEKASWPEIQNQFDKLLSQVEEFAYISLTHHTENRFGGGNYTDGIGLKEDGKRLLDYMAGKKIPIDLSHTSDLLAEGILNYIDLQKLDIPVIASHSNFRFLWNHRRNLTDEFAKEIAHRGGIIGVNFPRAFLDTDVPERLSDHLLHGFAIGAEKSVCFGADFFYTGNFPDKSRIPFYFPLAENSGKYPYILDHLVTDLDKNQLKDLAYGNALNFYRKLWELMSSHHFVKDQQEPAVFILDADEIHFDQVSAMLEWVPTVLVSEEAIDQVLSWGIKIDVILASEEFQKSNPQLLEEQYPLKFLTLNEANFLDEGLRYLIESDYKAVHLVGIPHQTALELEEKTGLMDLTIVDGDWKYYPVRSGIFKKWFAESTIHIHAKEGLPVEIRNSNGGLILPITYAR